MTRFIFQPKWATNIVHQLTRIGDGLMALKDELTELATKFDTATNVVAARLDALNTQVSTLLNNPNNITDEDKAAVKAKFQSEIDRLTVLGADPNNPVPSTSTTPTA